MTPLILSVKSLRFRPAFETLRGDELGLFRPSLDCKQRRSGTIAGVWIRTQVNERHLESGSARFWPETPAWKGFPALYRFWADLRACTCEAQGTQRGKLWARTRDPLPAPGLNSLRNHRCLNPGFRFSIKALIPSFWSSVANSEWNRRRSNSTPSVSVDS